MAYDDYRNESTLTAGADGTTIKRTIYLRGADEVEVCADPLCPVYGEAIDIFPGSTSSYIYCRSITVDAVQDAAGAATDGNFLWKITANYEPISAKNPTPNKARWEVGFRPQQYTLRNVKTELDQMHFGLDGSAENAWPPVTTGINVTEDGPQGVDIDEMVEVLTLEFWKYPGDVETYITAVRAIVNTVNNADFTGPWGTYAAGEARITGLSVASTTGEVSTVSIEISRSKNGSITTYLDSIGAEITYTKLGWDFAWVRFLKGNVTGDTQIRPISIDAHVATVYESGDYTALGVTSGIFT